MTNTITPPHTAATTGLDMAVRPADILMNLIVTFLVPMFLSVSAGDVRIARMAATETVNAYRAQSHADLIAVAQIVAFGLAALGSLSLSMADDISLSMTLRLRANANACNRSAQQNRRALAQPPADTAMPVDSAAEAAFASDEAIFQASVIANVAAVQQRATAAEASMNAPEPVLAQAPVSTAPVSTTVTADQQRQTMWAAAAAHVAAEYVADLPNLPPAERRAAMIRAAALSNSANSLLSGEQEPRLRSDALNEMMRPNPG